MFILQVNERIQELESGNCSKLGKKKIILKLLFFNIVFLKAELQKALTFAEEQMENVKVWI